MVPLNIKWVSQGSVNMAWDDELLELMAASGCLGVLIGFVIGLWVMAASIVSIKHALGYDDYIKPVIVGIIAAVPAFIVMFIVSLMILVPLGAGMWLTS